MIKQMMSKFKSNAKNWFLYLILAGIILNIVGTSFDISMIKRVGAYLTMISVLLCFIFTVIYDDNNIQSILMLLFLCYSMGVLLISASAKYENIINMLTFLEMPVLFFCYNKEDRKYVLDLIFSAFLLVAVVFFLCTFKSKYYNPGHNYGLAIGKHPDVNPNQTALQATQGVFILLCAVVYYKNVWKRLICVVGIILYLYVIYLTKCRTGLVVAVLCLALVIIQKFIRVKSYFVLVCCLVPVIMAIFIIYGRPIYSGWKFLGEDFDTGRISEYLVPFRNMSVKKFFFGNVGYHQFENNHNAFLTVFANMGIIGFSVFFGFIMHKMLGVFARPMLDYQYTAMVGMCILIVHASMEAATFMTTLSYLTIPFFLLYLIANTSVKKGLKGFEKMAHDLF